MDIIRRKSGLSGNQLKILALVAMTCDHMGKQLYPEWILLQIIGRLAFPIFAFMVAEGCRYTHNRRSYLFSMVKIAGFCQIVYFLAMDSLYQCILVTFSLSILLIYCMDNAQKKRSLSAWIVFVSVCAGSWWICVILPSLLDKVLPGTDFAIDYGIWGVLFPVLVYLGKSREQKALLAGIALVSLGISMQGIQWYGLASLPLLWFYNGERGRWRMKNFFYFYYPLHLFVIYLLGLVL
ncbi:MAG: hypothetical protein IKM28_10530 [Lachnospiraceae bacterium]|nr:hypothetical protein [Lachnospiraceae bacterium]